MVNKTRIHIKTIKLLVHQPETGLYHVSVLTGGVNASSEIALEGMDDPLWVVPLKVPETVWAKSAFFIAQVSLHKSYINVILQTTFCINALQKKIYNQIYVVVVSTHSLLRKTDLTITSKCMPKCQQCTTTSCILAAESKEETGCLTK